MTPDSDWCRHNPRTCRPSSGALDMHSCYNVVNTFQFSAPLKRATSTFDQFNIGGIMNLDFRSATVILISVLAVSVAGCASKKIVYAPAKLICTGVCAVGEEQAESGCRAQAVLPYTYSTSNFYTGSVDVHSSTRFHAGIYRDCMRGEGWEYLRCPDRQEQGCHEVDDRFIVKPDEKL